MILYRGEKEMRMACSRHNEAGSLTAIVLVMYENIYMRR
jgi:hypothetical protein